MKTKNILIVGGIAAIGVGLYYFFFKKVKDEEIEEPEQNLPTTSSLLTTSPNLNSIAVSELLLQKAREQFVDPTGLGRSAQEVAAQTSTRADLVRYQASNAPILLEALSNPPVVYTTPPISERPVVLTTSQNRAAYNPNLPPHLQNKV